VVQELLAGRRELKVQNERMRLEVVEMRSRTGKPDPKLLRLEQENRRLREELEAARGERDSLRDGVREALARLRDG